jgi:hypothetical protein
MRPQRDIATLTSANSSTLFGFELDCPFANTGGESCQSVSLLRSALPPAVLGEKLVAENFSPAHADLERVPARTISYFCFSVKRVFCRAVDEFGQNFMKSESCLGNLSPEDLARITALPGPFPLHARCFANSSMTPRRTAEFTPSATRGSVRELLLCGRAAP